MRVTILDGDYQGQKGYMIGEDPCAYGYFIIQIPVDEDSSSFSQVSLYEDEFEIIEE